MHLRRIAAMSAVILTSSMATSAVTHADTSSATTLYVNDIMGSNCSDSPGAGTQAQPFCTIQAAVNVANPGQTVSIASGTYAPATITRSGTATAPITIVGVVATRPVTGSNQFTKIAVPSANPTGAALTVSGASYVNITHVGIIAGSTGALVISNSSNITVNRTTVQGSSYDTSAPLVDITGSTAVAFQRSFALSAPATTIQVEGGSTGTVISTNIIQTSGTAPFVSASDAPGTDIVSNQMQGGCQTAVAVAQGSLNAVIENDWVPSPQNCTSPLAAISVDSTATATATVDYNALGSRGGPDYSWGGISYLTPTQFSVTGQGTHDAVGQTLIDSANSAAPGELPTDIFERPRVDDPLMPNTGAGPVAYYDRGAVETQEPLTLSTFYPSAGQAPTGGTVTFTAVASDTWVSTLTYVFNFGDGATKTNTTGVATHVYTTTGSYNPTVTVTGSDGVPASLTFPITIVPPAPLVAAMSVGSAGTMTAVTTQQSTDSWNITGYTVNFGDGTTLQAVTGTPGLIHSYKKLGTFNITLTSTDSQGATASTTQKFTTAGSEYTAYGPVRVLDTRHGIGTGGAVAKLGGGQTLQLKIGGNGTIPANASAVVFNLTVTNPSLGGYLVAYPDQQAKPATSNLNFTRGQTKATSVVVGVGASGYVDLYNGSTGTVDLIADVSGYFTQTEATRYTPLPPARILDTRTGNGTGGVKARIGGGQALPLTIAGADAGAVPATGVAAVALNLTAVDEAGTGYVTVYPDGSTRPVVSSLNFDAGQTVPNAVIVPVGADGKIDLYNGSGGPIDLIADIEGYFGTGSTDAYLPIAPSRLFDSRTSGPTFYSGGGNTTLLQPLGANYNVPLNFALSTVAYVYNVTVTGTVGSGYVTVYPDALPLTSNVNFTNGQTTSNTAIASGGAYASDQFTVAFAQPQSTTQLIVDLFGYFSAE